MARALAGLSGPSLSSLYQVCIGDISTEDTRPSLLGIILMVNSLAFALGAGFSAGIVKLGMVRRYVFGVSCALDMAAAAVCCALFPETLMSEQRKAIWHPPCRGPGDVRSFDGDGEHFASINPGLAWTWSARFFTAYSGASAYTTYASLVQDSFGWEASQFTLILFFFGVVSALVCGFVFPFFRERLTKHQVAVFGLVLSLIGCVLLAISAKLSAFQLPVHVAGISCVAFGTGLFEPAFPDIVTAYVPEPGYLGIAQGVTHACRTVATIFAPLTSSVIYDMRGVHVNLIASGALPILLAALSIVFADIFGVEARTFPNVELREMDTIIHALEHDMENT